MAALSKQIAQDQRSNKIMSKHAKYPFTPSRCRGLIQALVKSSAPVTRRITMGKYLLLGIVVILLMSGRNSLADEGLAGTGHIAEPVPSGRAQADLWGRVPTEEPSIANLAPVLLRYFNNGPAFGLPGTVIGDLLDRTQLTGDWGGTCVYAAGTWATTWPTG